MARNRGVNDPLMRAVKRPRARSRVVHVTVPRVRCRVTGAARRWPISGTDPGGTCVPAVQKRKMDLETFW